MGLLFILGHHKAQSAAKSCPELWELPLGRNNKEMGLSLWDTATFIRVTALTTASSPQGLLARQMCKEPPTSGFSEEDGQEECGESDLGTPVPPEIIQNNNK